MNIICKLDCSVYTYHKKLTVIVSGEGTKQLIFNCMTNCTVRIVYYVPVNTHISKRDRA